MDKEKKTLQHNVTSSGYRGDMRRLLGLPWVAAEVPKGYFSGLGVSPEKSGV